MSDKLSQRERIERAFKEYGCVSRNYYLDLPFDKITRLSGIIKVLRSEGWTIFTDTKSDPHDTIYRATPKKVDTYRVVETGEILTKKTWK